MYQSLTGADTELESAAAELDYANQRLADLKGELSALDQTVERLNHERELHSQQLLTCDQNLSQQEIELLNAERQASVTEQELNQLATYLEEAGQELLACERQHR